MRFRKQGQAFPPVFPPPVSRLLTGLGLPASFGPLKRVNHRFAPRGADAGRRWHVRGCGLRARSGVTPGELPANADLVHYTMGASAKDGKGSAIRAFVHQKITLPSGLFFQTVLPQLF